MSASQRRKGANGENELARILSDNFGRIVKRTLGQARDGGHDIETPPFRWEVKRRAKLAVYDFIEQAAEACQDGATPVVAMRADGKGWLVLMRLEDALPLIRGELTPTQFPPATDTPVTYTHAVVFGPDGSAKAMPLTEKKWPTPEASE